MPAARAASSISVPSGWPGSSPSGRLLTSIVIPRPARLGHLVGADLAAHMGLVIQLPWHPIVSSSAASAASMASP